MSKTVSKSEFARRLGVHRATVSNYARRGMPAGRRVGAQFVRRRAVHLARSIRWRLKLPRTWLNDFSRD
jgi:phage terminase Nu1 subunit (DNA packaging protein)